MKNKISAFAVMALVAFALFSFRMPEKPVDKEVFTCPLEFGILHTTSGGCTAYYVTGANYASFNWVGWEVFYTAGGSHVFKTSNPGSAWLTQTFGSSGCDEAAVSSVRAKSMRWCDGVPYLSDWVYYSID